MRYLITDQKIYCTEADHIVAGEQRIHYAYFTFDESWTGFHTRAIFKNGETEAIQEIVNGICEIPWEVTYDSGYLVVGVVGTMDDQIKPTIYAAPYHIPEGAYPEEGRTPTPDVWEQLLERSMPAGGTEGQVLTKTGDDDYDAEWQDPTGGGTRDYTDLTNKPQVNGHTLTGDQDGNDLGLANLEDIPDVSQFITKTVNDLVNYFTKAQTTAAIAEAIGQITQISYEIVQTLPATGENGTIYLVPLTETETRNYYSEYIYVSSSWEKIGDTQVDLSNYYTKTETDTLLGAKADQTDLDAHVNNKPRHVTDGERTRWNGIQTHEADTVIHITAAERTAWNAKANATDLTAHTGDSVIHITAAERATWNAKLDASALTPYATQVWVQQQGYLTQHQDISGKENTSNKVTSLSAQSTDTQYPSAKCVHDALAGKANTGDIPDVSGKENSSNKVTALTSASTDTQYPSAKCVYDIIGDVETLLASL